MSLNAFQMKQATSLAFYPMPYMREYLLELESRGCVPGYVRASKNSLTHFADFLRSEGLVHPGEIERVHLLRFQSFCNDQPWKKSYVIQIMKKARSWLTWMADLDYIIENPWRAIKVGSVGKVPKPLSDEEVDLLFAAHRQGTFGMSPFTFHRREMMLALLYSWGLRAHELAALNMANMDMRLEFVTVPNKGGGKKTLPYSEEIRKVFRRWAAARARYAKHGEDALLISTNGERMGYEDIYRVIVDLGKQAGVTINPHRLRDTCATHLLDDDVEAERVQKILGHSNLAMTLAYAKVNNRKVAESHSRAMDPRLARLFRNTRQLRLPDE